jgi:hypothetical protein
MRGRRLNIEPGTKFNMLEFVEKRKSIKDGKVTKSVGLFKCDCGVEKEYRILDVKNGHTKSCGCIRKTCNIKHGQTVGGDLSKEYIAWINMKERCTNKNMHHYKNYGGRGIKVCDEWLSSFLHFYEDIGKCPFSSYSLDRIDNNGDYSPENCRWASKKEQSSNTRKNINIEYDSQILNITEWSEKMKIPISTITKRYYRGVPLKLLFYKGFLTQKIINTYLENEIH